MMKVSLLPSSSSSSKSFVGGSYGGGGGVVSSSLVLLLVLLLTTTITPVVVANNSINPELNSFNDLLYDNNNKLVFHTIIYEKDNEDCIQKQKLNTFRSTPDFEIYSIDTTTSEEFQRIFDDSNDGDGCNVAYIERGVDRTLVSAIMPHHYYPKQQADIENQLSFSDWFESNIRMVELCLINYYSNPVSGEKVDYIDLYWKHPTTSKLNFHMEIYYGEQKTRCFKSFIGHEFEVYDSTELEEGRSDDNKGELVGTLRVEYITSMAFGTAPPSDGRSEGHDYKQEIYKTLDEEWRRHNRVKRTFSPLGFKKGRLPNDVFASMGSFYYNNRYNKVLEEWGGKGVFVNWWETDIYFIQIPWGLKDIWQKSKYILVLRNFTYACTHI